MNVQGSPLYFPTQFLLLCQRYRIKLKVILLRTESIEHEWMNLILEIVEL